MLTILQRMKKNKIMKIYPKSFTITIIIIWAIFILINTIWSRVSANYGIEFMVMYHSIHPHPFLITKGDLTLVQHIYGVLFDVFYAIVDAFIIGLSFSVIYNFLIDKIELK
ncbi:MAG: hypothetical protein KatS3mg129_2987 [Leptospiraceae bacterium]|nr:MAG: hypothetical protein KatS3mg129_2987 [Leptospiraceae bacterium]